MNDKVPIWKSGMRVVVWFDTTRDALCFVDRMDKGLEEGKAVPDERIVRIPYDNVPAFVQAVMNYAIHAGLSGNVDDMTKLLDGIQALLDQQAARAIGFSEHLHMEREKASGGIVNRNGIPIVVRADHLTRLRDLRAHVVDLVRRHKTGEFGPNSVLRDLQDWLEKNDLDAEEDLGEAGSGAVEGKGPYEGEPGAGKTSSGPP